MIQIAQTTTAEQFLQVSQLREEMGRWDAQQSCRLGLDPAEVLAHFYPTDVAGSRAENMPPDGCCLLATYAGDSAGCGAFRRMQEGICELHYLYVRDQFRRKRIGRQLVEELVVTARNAGYRTMWLESATFMSQARELYASVGFLVRRPYYQVPMAFEPMAVFMELTLTAAIGRCGIAT